MKSYKLFFTVILALLIAVPQSLFSQKTMTAKEIVKKADEKNRGLSSKGTMTMIIERPKWSRSVSMKIWSKGSEYYIGLYYALFIFHK